MGASIHIKGFSSKDNPLFLKHFNAVVYCIQNELSYPKETSEFFKGKLDGGDLEDFTKETVIKMLENGLPVKLPMNRDDNYEYRIKVSEIPVGVEEIIVSLR